jgi:plastocyanin
MIQKSLIILIIVLGGLIIVGCTSKTPEEVTFTIDMTEFAFTPERLDVKVGQQVTLNLVNKGQLPHEIMFGRDVAMENGRPSGYKHDMFEEAGVEPVVMLIEEGQHIDAEDEHTESEEHEDDEHAENEDHGHEGFMVLLNETGEEGSISFTVTEDMVGEWEMGCFELDGVHYTAGMVGTFVVTE